MIPKFIKLLSLLLFLLAFLPAHTALADTGPKPSMEFTFKQELADEPVTIVSGILYECEQSDCSDATPLKELGPQRFTCEADGCSALGYGFAPYHKIEIEFSDGQTRQSNIFETAGFDSKYTVTVRPLDLLVEAQFSLKAFSSINLLLIACVCALVGVVLLVVLIIFILQRRSKN